LFEIPLENSKIITLGIEELVYTKRKKFFDNLPENLTLKEAIKPINKAKKCDVRGIAEALIKKREERQLKN